jgi:hypothetical protein
MIAVSGSHWDLSGRQANVKEFHTTKGLYAQKKVLMQHGDNVRHVDHGTKGND